MNESDYIKATNRVKVSAALNLLRDVLPGRKYGISEAKLQSIIKKLVVAEEKLFKSFNINDR